MGTPLFQYLIFSINILLLLLLALVLYLTKKENDRLDKGEVLPNQKIIKNALQKSDSIIGKAVSKAQDILSFAQSKRLNLFAAEKLLSNKIIENYRQEIKSLETNLQEKFARNTASADKSYQDFLSDIEHKIKLSLDANQRILDDKATVFIDTAGKSPTDFTAQLENQIKAQIDAEMQKARGEIDEYRIHRQKVMDEKIVDILEEVLALSIDKKLSLADQSDFIYKALEEAKKNHAFK